MSTNDRLQASSFTSRRECFRSSTRRVPRETSDAGGSPTSVCIRSGDREVPGDTSGEAERNVTSGRSVRSNVIEQARERPPPVATTTMPSHTWLPIVYVEYECVNLPAFSVWTPIDKYHRKPRTADDLRNSRACYAGISYSGYQSSQRQHVDGPRSRSARARMWNHTPRR